MTAVPQKPCPPADPVPARPRIALPANACDTHAHIFGPASTYAIRTVPRSSPATSAYDGGHAKSGGSANRSSGVR